MVTETKQKPEIKSTYKVVVVQAADIPFILDDTDPTKPRAFIFTLYAWRWTQDWFDTGHHKQDGILNLAQYFAEALKSPVFLADKQHNLMKCISDIIGMHPDAQIIRVV